MENQTTENQDYQRLHKDAKKCMRLSTLMGCGFFFILELIVLFIANIGGAPGWLWIALGVIAILLTAYLIGAPKVRYARYRYRIDEESIRVREGFLWINYSIVPIERLHKIELSQGPLARMFGLYTVTVTTAGGQVSIKFLKEEVANEIAEHLKTVINQMASEERANS
ncbi:MAG: PH domain-containing protein [Firmicutes bacterium]|nr:PH domain-containing protein [Bacillota bacterium]